MKIPAAKIQLSGTLVFTMIPTTC